MRLTNHEREVLRHHYTNTLLLLVNSKSNVGGHTSLSSDLQSTVRSSMRSESASDTAEAWVGGAVNSSGGGLL